MSSKKNSKKDITANARQTRRRERMKDAGCSRRDVWAHPDDWEIIRRLEKKLLKKRGIDTD